MNLQEAECLGEQVLKILKPLVERGEIAGSIRRRRLDVNDIDIVAIPDWSDIRIPNPLYNTTQITHVKPDETWTKNIPKVLTEKLGLQFLIGGKDLLRMMFRVPELQVDIYRARPETWGIIQLIRTGSKEHNVKLCSLARSKGLKLSACSGVVGQEGFGPILASRTEEEIFRALGLEYVAPEKREVQV